MKFNPGPRYKYFVKNVENLHIKQGYTKIKHTKD